MKFPLVIRTSHFPLKPYAGISLCGFIFFRKDVRVTDVEVRHELIHFRQQQEWLFLPFFLLYVAEFLYHLVRLRNWHQAYRAISFEREAYHHQSAPHYLNHRPHWANYHLLP